MRISFIGQPLSTSDSLVGEWLRAQLEDASMMNLRIAVAWAKRSGLSQISELLRIFRERGGKVSAIIGIDAGGATSQGLKLAKTLFDATYIFYDKQGRTFHPKVYVAVGDTLANVLIGSANMTAGGLYRNYEAALVCHLDLADIADQAFLKQIQDWFDELIADSDACKLLTDDLLNALITNRRYDIGNEDIFPSRTQRQREEASEPDSKDVNIFGISSTPKRSWSPSVNRAETPTPLAPPALISNEPSDFPLSTSDAGIQMLWYKQLTGSDAQWTSNPGTKRTGNLKLTQARKKGIDQQTYFRYQFFGRADWRTDVRDQEKEIADIEFEVTIEGESKGTYNLRIDHKPSRVANQNNAPTWLHWGKELGEVLRSNDFTGTWVVITQDAQGRYRLEITRNEPD